MNVCVKNHNTGFDIFTRWTRESGFCETSCSLSWAHTQITSVLTSHMEHFRCICQPCNSLVSEMSVTGNDLTACLRKLGREQLVGPAGTSLWKTWNHKGWASDGSSEVLTEDEWGQWYPRRQPNLTETKSEGGREGLPSSLLSWIIVSVSSRWEEQQNTSFKAVKLTSAWRCSCTLLSHPVTCFSHSTALAAPGYKGTFVCKEFLTVGVFSNFLGARLVFLPPIPLTAISHSL